MKSFDEWNSSMSAVYDKFRRFSNEVPKVGLENTIPEFTSGYYLLFRLPESVRSDLGSISREISQTTPSVVYNPGMLHLTCTDFSIRSSHVFEYDEKMLSEVDGIVSNVICKGVQPPIIRLADILYNCNAAVVEGHPVTRTFYEFVKEVLDRCNKQGVDMREPWGSHITISRFLGDSETDNFLKLMKSLKPVNKLITLTNLELGHFMWRGHALYWRSYQSYEIKE